MLAVKMGKQVNYKFIAKLLGAQGGFRIPADFKELRGLRVYLEASERNINYFVSQCNRIAKAKSEDSDTKIV